MQLQQQDQFKVAPIISDQKARELLEQIAQTLLGASSKILEKYLLIIWSVILPLITILLPLFISSLTVAIVAPTIINIFLNFILQIVIKKCQISLGKILQKNIVLGIYTFLWCNHMYCIRQYDMQYIFMYVLSSFSIVTSINTIAIHPVKQFAGNGVDYEHFSLESTLYMRFFIIFPTLLAEFIIYNSQTVNNSSAYLYPLLCINSLICIVWWMGWLSSIKNTLHVVLNKIGMIVQGNQSQFTLKDAFVGILVNLIPIAVHDGIYQKSNVSSLNPLIVSASMTSVITFFRYNIFWSSIGANTYIKSLCLIAFQIVFCIILCLISSKSDLSSVKLSILLAIDIGLYLFFNFVKECISGWSRFGFTIQLSFLKYSHLALIERICLRVVAGLCILLILVNYESDYTGLFAYDQRIISYIVIPFLGYRSFKRTLSETTSFSLHFSLLICLILINTGYAGQGCLLVLMMPPFPSNCFLVFTSIFSIPPKAKHKNQCYYQILYLIVTLIGVCLHYLSLGILQLTMIFGLPLYMPTISTQTEGYQVRSVDNSLYEKILQNIDTSIFSFYQVGYYLLRIEKYILLMEVKSGCFGFCQALDFRGLQVQEVTSCHSKEGATIDKLIEQTWADNKKCFSLEPFYTAISPFLKEKVFVPTENDIQLTGVIEAQQFITLFKQNALKSIIRQYSKITLSPQQRKQGQLIISEISAFYKKQAAESVFPFQFAKHYNISAAYPLPTNKMKLPPIKKNSKKNQILNDFLDLVEASDPIESSLTGFNQKQKQGISESKKQTKIEEINMAVILTLYYYSVGKLNYINTSTLYRIIKRETDVLTQIEFDGFPKLLSIALAAALKISIDKYIQGQFDATHEDFLLYDSTGFLGTSDSEQFKDAILQDKQDIWTVTYTKKNLSIKRMARTETNMHIFKVNDVILKSVWNNLRFELVYATNDNDQRYSIQTHPTMLRNLWVQACEQPFGYPGYHSGVVINRC